jgi:hypothetical protein
LTNAVAVLPIRLFGISKASIPFKINVYVFIGSEAWNGGRPSINSQM